MHVSCCIHPWSLNYEPTLEKSNPKHDVVDSLPEKIKYVNLSHDRQQMHLPLTFLSGTFYSVERLPEFWHFIAHWNPFFYMIDGFRTGFIGYGDSNISVGILVLAIINLFFLFLTIFVFKKGFGLKT